MHQTIRDGHSCSRLLALTLYHRAGDTRTAHPRLAPCDDVARSGVAYGLLCEGYSRHCAAPIVKASRDCDAVACPQGFLHRAVVRHSAHTRLIVGINADITLARQHMLRAGC